MTTKLVRFWGWDRVGVRDAYDGTYTRFGRANANEVCRINPGGFQLEGYGRITIAGEHYPVLNKLFGEPEDNPCNLPQ